MLELSLCNELLAEDGLSLARAAALGYRGLELAPGTLSARPHAMSGAEWRAVRDRWDPDQVFQSALGQRLGLSGD